MELDVPTLIAVEAFIAAVSAGMIVVAATPGRDSRGSLWWALAGVTTAAAMVMILAGELRDVESVLLAAYVVLAFSSAFYWTGARVFAGRRPIYPLLFAGPAAKALLGLAPVPQLVGFRLELSFAISAVYLFAGGAELIRGHERVVARWFLVALLFVHGGFFVAGAVEAFLGDLPPMPAVPLGSWFGLVHFETIVFSIGSAAFVIAFVRERSEARQRRLAEVDVVTGVATRRAFIAAMKETMERNRSTAMLPSVAAFDLDNFKAINDTHGHAMGDKVLKLFGDTVRGVSRRDDRVGRLGGEEFALLLPETSLAAALEIGERVRLMFEAVGRTVDGIELGATVSVGVATAARDSTVQSLLIAADAGLYEAKARGRNRVERAPRGPGRPVSGSLRVA